MIDKETAIQMQKKAVRAIELLHDALTLSIDKCSTDEFQAIRLGVASSIATIDTELLIIIYAQYPELDHVK
jgi:hypothetical protein